MDFRGESRAALAEQIGVAPIQDASTACVEGYSDSPIRHPAPATAEHLTRPPSQPFQQRQWCQASGGDSAEAHESGESRISRARGPRGKTADDTAGQTRPPARRLARALELGNRAKIVEFSAPIRTRCPPPRAPAITSICSIVHDLVTCRRLPGRGRLFLAV